MQPCQVGLRQRQKLGLLHRATGSLDLGTTGHIFPLTWEVNLAGLCDRQVLMSLSYNLSP